VLRLLPFLSVALGVSIDLNSVAVALSLVGAAEAAIYFI
jgi:hypothetical protein